MMEMNAAARPIAYRPAAEGRPFECVALSDLRRRMGDTVLMQLEQLRFDMVVAPNEGSGTHEVDFETAVVGPDRWLHIRSGQVHRWILDGFEADLILLEPRSVSPAWRPGPFTIEVTDDQRHDLQPLLELLRHRRRADPDRATLLAIRDLVVRWLSLDAAGDSTGIDPLYSSFRAMLDREVLKTRSVAQYAKQLSCSTRTLARACARAGAPSPKRLIDEAVLLEAQRLLALPDATVTGTSVALEFDEVTNFTKFFKRVGGQAPTEWQALHAVGPNRADRSGGALARSE